MVNLMIGAGQAGGAILDAVFQYKNVRVVAKPIAINSTAKDLQSLRHIKKEERIGVSDSEGFVFGNVKGFEEKVTGGFGKNPVKAAALMEKHYGKLVNLIKEEIESEAAPVERPSKFKSKGKKEDKKGGSEEKNKKQEKKQDVPEEKTRSVPFAFIIVGLGGGTGSGITPHIAKVLKESFNMPVVIVGVLPASIEHSDADKREAGDRQAWNAWRCINEVMPYTSSFILVDNQRISFSPNMEALYPKYNDYVARAIVDIISGSMLEKIDMSKYDFNLPVLDINDMISATSFSDSDMKSHVPGFSIIGRASDMVRGLPNYFFPVGGYKVIDTLTLAQVALEKLSVENVDPKQARKNMLFIRVPPSYVKNPDLLDMKFLKNFMLEHSQLNEVHEGVALTKRNLASLTMLLTFKADDLSRIKEIERFSRNYEQKSGSLTQEYRKVLMLEPSVQKDSQEMPEPSPQEVVQENAEAQ